MSPTFSSFLKNCPYMFKNKVITTNYIRFCLSQYNMTEFLFLSGMKDFHESPTPERAMFLFNSFCTYKKTTSGNINSDGCLLNINKENVALTKNLIETGISDYVFANKFSISGKNGKKSLHIPASLGSCLDLLLKETYSTLIGNFGNFFSETGIYTNYLNKSIFTTSNKSNSLINHKVTEVQKNTLKETCEFMYFPMINLEMKTMISVVKEVQNMK